MRRVQSLTLFLSLFVGGAILLVSPSALAQADRGSITGVVSDTTGAVIPDAAVSATNVATGVMYNVPTSNLGLYTILNLPLGKYAVTFRKDGFQSIDRSNITVSTAQVVQLDVKMSVGAETQVMTVTDDAPALETQTSDVGTNMKAAPIQDLPFNAQGGRHIEQFVYDITPSAQGDPYLAVIAGGQGFTKEVVIDGTSQNASIQGDSIEAEPSMEAVEEVDAQTSGLTAERGISSGGVVSFGLKSGTNQFHGSAFGFGHNEITDANTWDNGHTGDPRIPGSTTTRKPEQRFWDYGFSAGGPIFKNKTFIFGALEKFQQHDFTLAGFGNASTLPTTAFLGGDFSGLLGSGLCSQTDGSVTTRCDVSQGDAPVIVQNNAGQSVPLQQGMIFDPQTGHQFTGNAIPSTRFSSVANNLIPIYQQHYKPENGSLTNNDRTPSQNSPVQTPIQVTIKMDHNVSDRNHISGSFIYNRRPRLLNDSGGVWAPGSTDGGPLATARIQKVVSYSWRAADSFAIRPNLLNVLTATYNYYWNGSLPTSSAGNWPSKLGLGSGYADNFPSIDFGPAINNVGETYIGNSWQGNWVGGTYIYGDTVSWVKGRHTFKFGGEFRAMQINSHSQDGTMHFSFTNDFTGAATQPYNSQVGFGFASMLLGGVQKASVDTPFNLYGRRKSLSFFGQDDFKINPKLTLSLGLRWEITNPLHEKDGHWANFDPTLINPVTGTPGAMAFATGGSDTFEKNRDWRDFGPTVGLAYSVTNRLVMRGAVGIYYAPLVMNYYEGIPYGFAPGYRGTNQVSPAGPGKAAFNWDSGYTGTFIPGTKDPNFFPYGTVALDPNALKLGYTDQWNIGGQYELGKNTVLDVTYLGNRGHRLHDGSLANFRAPASKFFPLFGSNYTAYNWVSDQASAAAAGVAYPYPGFAGFAYQAVNPFPQVDLTYGPIYAVDSPVGQSRYDALQVEIKKRTGSGLTADFSYVLSKSTTNTNSAFSEGYPYSLIQDPTNLGEAANTLSAYDQKHVFKGYLTYELPFGRGKRFVGDSRGFVKGLVSGWTLGTLLRYNTGQPLGFFSSNYYAYPDWTVTYMNFGPGVGRTYGGHFVPPTGTNPTPSQDLYFNPALVTNPPYAQLGTGPSRIDALRGFGAAYENASVIKYFSMGANDRYKLQLRVEFYNIFNRHYLSDPVTNPGGSNFGYVLGTNGNPPRQGQFGARFTW